MKWHTEGEYQAVHAYGIQLIKQLIIADESINQETSSSTKQSNDDLLSSIQNSQNQSSFMKSVGKS